MKLNLKKNEFIADVLKETFLKTYKPPQPMIFEKIPKCSKQLF